MTGTVKTDWGEGLPQVYIGMPTADRYGCAACACAHVKVFAQTTACAAMDGALFECARLSQHAVVKPKRVRQALQAVAMSQTTLLRTVRSILQRTCQMN